MRIDACSRCRNVLRDGARGESQQQLPRVDHGRRQPATRVKATSEDEAVPPRPDAVGPAGDYCDRMSIENGPRVAFQLSPGATLQWHVHDAPNGLMAPPLWLVWSRLAVEHAAIAEAARESDRVIDAVSLALQNPSSTIEDYLDSDDPRPTEGTAEFDASLIAIVASAVAVDGLYGSVKPLINPPASTATRPRQIIETLKLGFSIGRESHRWLPELDWLFDVRDVAVHHAEELRPMTIVRVTAETVLVSSNEAWYFSAPNAHRAANLCAEIIDVCLAKPKRATREWATTRRHGTGAET
jgi:hypothetical protein